MEIAAANQWGRLTSPGAAALDGTLHLALVNGFSPAIGNSFQVMTFASRTGQFATINGTALGNPFGFAQGTRGKQFSPAYAATNLTLNVTAPSAHSASLRAPAPAQGTRVAPILVRLDSKAEAEEGNRGGWKWARGMPDAQELTAPSTAATALTAHQNAQNRIANDRVRSPAQRNPDRGCARTYAPRRRRISVRLPRASNAAPHGSGTANTRTLSTSSVLSGARPRFASETVVVVPEATKS